MSARPWRLMSREAAIPNPALEPLEALVGSWDTVGTHSMIPGTTLHGRASFEWLEGGAFLIVRSEIDEPGIPTGIAIIGSDDTMAQLFMLYFDERGVSRMYDVSWRDNVLKWWRDAPGFAQRFTGTLSDDRNTMVGVSELSRDGSTWERDLELTYTRRRAR